MATKMREESLEEKVNVFVKRLVTTTAMILWLLCLILYHNVFHEQDALQDIWSKVAETPQTEKIINESTDFKISERFHVLILEKTPIGEIVAKEIIGETATLDEYSGDKTLKYRIEYLKNEHASNKRVVNYSERTVDDFDAVGFSNEKLLKIAIIVHCMLLISIGLLSFIVKGIASNLHVVNVIAVMGIGIIHSMYVYLQGGILLSPMGMVAGAVIPIVFIETVNFVDNKRSIGSKLLFLIPAGVFFIGHFSAEILARRVLDDSVSILVNDIYQGYGHAFFLLAIILGVAASIVRKKFENGVLVPTAWSNQEIESEG